jgi:hypothetical protein
MASVIVLGGLTPKLLQWLQIEMHDHEGDQVGRWVGRWVGR